MKILKPTTDTQTIKLIPRNYSQSTTVQLRDDQTNVTTVYTPIVTQENDYQVYSGVFNLEEGHYYDLLVQNDYDVYSQNSDYWNLSTNTWNDINFKVDTNIVDKIFCTDQDIDQSEQEEYSVNKDVYKSDLTYDKEYIIYE
tara:strand:- start:89 stop:511 length:423 start_codon:yes stop_codon:yes gene_type:complete